MYKLEQYGNRYKIYSLEKKQVPYSLRVFKKTFFKLKQSRQI